MKGKISVCFIAFSIAIKLQTSVGTPEAFSLINLIGSLENTWEINDSFYLLSDHAAYQLAQTSGLITPDSRLKLHLYSDL